MRGVQVFSCEARRDPSTTTTTNEQWKFGENRPARPAVCYNPTHAHSAYKLSGAAGISAGALQQQIDLFHRIAEDGQTELVAAN